MAVQPQIFRFRAAASSSASVGSRRSFFGAGRLRWPARSCCSRLRLSFVARGLRAPDWGRVAPAVRGFARPRAGVRGVSRPSGTGASFPVPACFEAEPRRTARVDPSARLTPSAVGRVCPGGIARALDRGVDCVCPTSPFFGMSSHRGIRGVLPPEPEREPERGAAPERPDD